MSELNNKVLFKSRIENFLVSTVFLGIDHRFIGRGPPLLFETMTFKDEIAQDLKRYSSYDDAETGHKTVVDRIKRGLEVK